MFLDTVHILPIGQLISSVNSWKETNKVGLKWHRIDQPSESTNVLRYFTWFISCIIVLLFPWPNTTIQRTFIHGISISMLVSSIAKLHNNNKFSIKTIKLNELLTSKEWLLFWGIIHGMTHVIWPFVDEIVGANQEITPFYDITVHLSMTIVHYLTLYISNNNKQKQQFSYCWQFGVFKSILIFINVINAFNVFYLAFIDLNLFGYFNNNDHKFLWANDNLFGNTAGITTIGYALWVPLCLWHNKWNNKNYYIVSILFVIITCIIYTLFRMDHDNIAFAMKYCFIDSMMIICVWPLWYPICQ